MALRPILSDSESDNEALPSAQAGPSTRRLRPSEQSQGGRKKMKLSDVFTRQDRETKARLGRDYRDMQVRAEDMKANLANISLAQVKQSMRQQERLFKEVKDTSLAALDARLMHTTADTALDLARKMKIEGNVFDMDEFLLRVGSLLGLDRPELDEQDPDSEEDELDESLSDRGARRRAPARKGHLGDWEKLGWMAARLNRRVTGVEFLYGPLKVTPRAPIQRTQRKKVVEPETRPQEISTQPQATAAADEKDTVALVKQVGDVLERSDPDGRGINFFRLIIDPDDFGQSVENCFYLSFLIKEGKAGIDVMDDGEVMIYAKDGNDMEVDGDVTRHQAVVELDMDTWEEAKQLFNITSSTIPHRHYTEAGPLAANTWYS